MLKNKRETKSKGEKVKHQKPYLSCTRYPHDCNAVGCDYGQRPCQDYKQESATVFMDWGSE